MTTLSYTTANSVAPMLMGMAVCLLVMVGLGETYALWNSLLTLPSWASHLAFHSVISILGLVVLTDLQKSIRPSVINPIYFLPAVLILSGSVTLAYLFPSASSAGSTTSLPYLIASITLVPLTEEIVFRGVLNRLFQRIVSNQWSIYLTAFVFAVAHSSPTLYRIIHLEAGVTLGPFLLGLVCGWLVLKSKSMWPAIAFHCACNSTVLIFNQMSPEWFERLGVFYLR